VATPSASRPAPLVWTINVPPENNPRSGEEVQNDTEGVKRISWK
jgi:hypothetical protein